MTGCLDDEAIAAWSAGELPEADRAASVDHIAECARCRAIFVEALARPTQDPPVIGRYQLRETLGAGGMGVVFDAWDPVLERAAAIKMIKAALDQPADRARLLAEARALARLAHPNVVAVYECGEAGDELFVAMARVDGVTFDRWLAGDRSVAGRRAVLAEVAAGLAAIHGAGLVHRDLKPDNVLVQPDGHAVIVDLGLARAHDRPALGAGSGIAGTPRFLAPEVADGGAATAASDQHAWWQLVVTALPALPPVMARRLARVSGRGLAADPAARYHNMADAAAALDAALRPRRSPIRGVAAGIAAVAVAAAALSAGLTVGHDGDAPAPCAPNAPAGWSPAVAVRLEAALRAAGIDPVPVRRELTARAETASALTARACRDARAGDVAIATRARRQSACVETTWAQTERTVAEMLGATPALVAAGAEELAVIAPLEACRAGSLPALPAPPAPEMAAEVAALEQLLRELRADEPRAAPARLEALDALGPRIAAVTHAPLAATWHHDRSDALMQLGRLDDSDRELALTANIAGAAGDDDTRARALINRLRLAFQAGRADTAELEGDAAATVERLANPTLTAELDVSMARIRMVTGDVPAAIARLTHALAIYDGLVLPAPRRTVAVLQDLGAASQLGGDLDAAQRAFDRGYALARAAFGDDARATVELRGARATNFLYRGDPAAAEELAAVAAALVRLDGAASHNLMAVQGYRCELHLEAEVVAAASGPCTEALAIGEQVFGDRSPQLVWPLMLRGRYLMMSGAPVDAIAVFDRALTIADENTPIASLPAMVRGYRALAYQASGQRVRAVAMAREARAALARLPAQPDVTAMLSELAAVFP